jgi:fucose permease
VWRTAIAKGADVPVVVWLGFAAFIGLGLPEATLGVTWPSIRAELDRPLSSVGILLVSITVGYLPSSALSGRVVRVLGAGRMLGVATGLYVAGLSLYMAGPAFGALVLGSVLSGAAAGMIDPGLNAHFAVHHGPRAMNLLHASFGVGATLGPFIATIVIGLGGSWRVPYAIYVAIQLSLLAGFALTRDRWSVGADDRSSAPDTDVEPSDAPQSVVALSIVEFFLYTGLEVSAGVLAFTLLTEGRGVSDGAAGLWTTAYWASLTAGRFLLGVAGHRVRPEQVLRRGTIAAILGTLLLAGDPAGQGAAGLPILGFALAGLFPSMVLLTPRRVGVERTAGLVGIQFSVAAIGASGVPAAISWWATDDVERIGPALVFLALAIAGVDLLVDQRSRSSRSSR